MNRCRIISGMIDNRYYYTNHNSSIHSMKMMIEQSKFCDSTRVFEIFIHFEDAIMFEGCYFRNTLINLYCIVKVTNPINETRLKNCNFSSCNNRRTFYVSNDIYGTVQFSNINLNNIIIQGSDNNNDICHNCVYFDSSRYEL